MTLEERADVIATAADQGAAGYQVVYEDALKHLQQVREENKADRGTALRLLREAEERINSLGGIAQGDRWFGDDLADSIGEFLRKVEPQEG